MTTAGMIPEHLAEEYRLVGRIDDRRSPNIVLCVETIRTRRRSVLKLPARSCLADDVFLDALSRRAAGPDNRLAVPFRVGRGRDGRFFTMAEYHPAGSLRACLAETGRLPEAAIRPLVRDVAAGLAQLHRDRDGRRIVHCDVKPSNVLVARRGSRETDGWEFRLSDFDSAVLTPLDDPAPLARTVGYAAPEACGDAHPPDPAMDYWSLGMLVLTGVRGRHPFDGLPDEEVRKLLVTDWQVDAQYLSDIPDEACRALIGGLMQRNPADRWGEARVCRWLDGDAETIVSGLHILGENAAPTPFFIGGEACHTAGNTARALLRSWDTGALYDDAFPRWLHTLSPIAAHCAGQARALHPDHRDAGLLHFCRTLHPGGPERMPAVWRREPISASGLAALAGRAGRGDDGARTWLLGFLGEGGGADTLAAAGFGDVAALVRSIRDAHREYGRAWREIIDAGAPSGSAPSEDDARVHAVLIACSPAAARSMPRELFDPLLVMQRADWVFAFGTDPDRLDPSRRFVLRQLHRASLVRSAGLAAIDARGDIDPRALRDGIALSDLQRRLLRSLVVRAGARIVTLAAGDTWAPERPPPGRLTPVEGAPGVFRRPARPRASPPADAPSPAGEPALTMRIVRLDVVSRPPSAAGDEIHLALIAWSGAAPGACLTVHGIDTPFAARRLRIPVGGNDGRMLLVVDRNTRVELRGAGSGRAERRRSIRILVRRGSRTRLRHLTRDVLSIPRRGLRRVLDPIRKAMGLPAASRGSTILHAVRPARWPAAIRTASSWRHAGGPAVLPSRKVAGVAAGTRQRRRASSYLKRVASQPGPRSP
ncbi:MAG: protein kinase [Chromatiales bacterium]|nr:protein kinase [Chromatiales bacterium]